MKHAPVLRPYQEQIVDAVEEDIAASNEPLLVAMPTGAGKTVTSCENIRRARQRRQSVLVLAHRREIVFQTSGKLLANQISHGIIQAGIRPRPLDDVQVASIQTLHARAMRGTTMELPKADLVIVDEAHHATANSWREIIKAYPDSKVIGWTATPCRGDGNGLGGIFRNLIEGPQVQELIDLGFLVRTKVFAPAQPDLKGVKVQAGDWIESQLAERMDRKELVGDIVTHWHRHGGDRRTVVFATGVQHSLHIRDEFLKAGVRCEHIDGSTPKPERDEILQRLGNGELDVVTNCMVLTEGWDMPDVGCCILARPTRKMGLFRQMIGRGLRPAEGKADVVVIDHSGAVHRHGFVEDPVCWTLDPERKATNPTHVKRCGKDGTASSRIVECSQCGGVRLAGDKCHNCGFKPEPPPKVIDFHDGDLAHITRDGARRIPLDQNAWHRQLAWIASERGYKPGWVAHKFKEKFGVWPPRFVEPEPSSREVEAWVRSRNIAYAKAQRQGAA